MERQREDAPTPTGLEYHALITRASEPDRGEFVPPVEPEVRHPYSSSDDQMIPW